MNAIVWETTLPGIQFLNRGKVRDLYQVGDRLLIVATDRLSAFDVVLPTPIPDKGRVLTQLSLFWFDLLRDIIPNHVLSAADFPPELAAYSAQLNGRSMLCEKTKPLPIECVVRGYLAGSGWKEYREQGTLAGLGLPAGLLESDRLPEPRFTPATKNDSGHDENISISQMAAMYGPELTAELHQLSLELYNTAATIALERGVILADTKLEFGFIDGKIHLIDECFTPDSSRYWDAQTYERGKPQPSMDKQYLRDWLESQNWDKAAPGPELPEEIVLGTRERYLLAYRRVTGQDLNTGRQP